MAGNKEAEKKKIADLALQIADHQANLQIISSNWGEQINNALDATEKRFLEQLQKELKNFDFVPNRKKTLEQLEKINKKLSEFRLQALNDAQAALMAECEKLAENETKWAKRVTRELAGKKGMKDVSEAGISKIAENALSGGRTFRQWFRKLEEDDASRIDAVVQQGVSSGWTVDQIADRIAGTAGNGYRDGVFNTTRQEAVNMARTICNGVANSAKMAFYQANDAFITGVEILSTLDGRTCPVCASLDRKRYKMNETPPSLPLHPQCRCVLLPVTPASDFADEQRPMANADFMKEAQRLYEERNKDKKFSDLDYDLKKKLYYQAMREYEKKTGKPAYQQSDGAISFRDYFTKHMTEQQRKDWLGPERYRLWKNGMSLDNFIPPYPQKRMTVEELKKLDKAGFEK